MKRIYHAYGILVLLVLAWAQWTGAAFASTQPGKTRVGGGHGSGSSISRHK